MSSVQPPPPLVTVSNYGVQRHGMSDLAARGADAIIPSSAELPSHGPGGATAAAEDLTYRCCRDIGDVSGNKDFSGGVFRRRARAQGGRAELTMACSVACVSATLSALLRAGLSPLPPPLPLPPPFPFGPGLEEAWTSDHTGCTPVRLGYYLKNAQKCPGDVRVQAAKPRHAAGVYVLAGGEQHQRRNSATNTAARTNAGLGITLEADQAGRVSAAARRTSSVLWRARACEKGFGRREGKSQPLLTLVVRGWLISCHLLLSYTRDLFELGGGAAPVREGGMEEEVVMDEGKKAGGYRLEWRERGRCETGAGKGEQRRAQQELVDTDRAREYTHRDRPPGPRPLRPAPTSPRFFALALSGLGIPGFFFRGVAVGNATRANLPGTWATQMGAAEVTDSAAAAAAAKLMAPPAIFPSWQRPPSVVDASARPRIPSSSSSPSARLLLMPPSVTSSPAICYCYALLPAATLLLAVSSALIPRVVRSVMERAWA
ncbi:hypothetical protein Purlil1_5954 [Purpureocillium lilacinum]|uniref:Uncharacterized protein n=1 Tax=Purpureocillium lilacinum TaxID=33203 RepID=A0ABR0C1E9_PURLI|nr:hypothetical protein Purlil1_5954 [Purpureocillium lilacinum]